jgi:hypothetical protein
MSTMWAGYLWHDQAMSLCGTPVQEDVDGGGQVGLKYNGQRVGCRIEMENGSHRSLAVPIVVGNVQDRDRLPIDLFLGLGLGHCSQVSK